MADQTSSVAKNPRRGVVFVLCDNRVHGILGGYDCLVRCTGLAGLYGEIGRYG